MDRRHFLGALAAGVALPPLLRSPLAATGSTDAAARLAGEWPGYDRALVIDFLASPGWFNSPVNPPLDAGMLQNALDSGITAVNLTVSGGGAGGAAFVNTVARMATWEARIAAHPDVLVKVRSLDELRAAKAARRLGIIYGFQDATMLETDLDRLRIFHDLGVRVIQLTYNGRNLLGDGCLEPANAGLSRFGHAVVERMNELGIMVDLSHCGQQTTADGIAASRLPVAISHSGCSAVAPHPRSKHDEELRAMAERGGVIGIYLMPFLSPGRVPTADDVIAHIEHAVRVCGEDHVGIGSDLSITPIDPTPEYWAMHREFVARRKAAGTAAPAEDEAVLFHVPDLATPRRLERIATLLSARGHADARIEKIIGGNWVRVMEEAWR
jgi:membrane dipeptidase